MYVSYFASAAFVCSVMECMLQARKLQLKPGWLYGRLPSSSAGTNAKQPRLLGLPKPDSALGQYQILPVTLCQYRSRTSYLVFQKRCFLQHNRNMLELPTLSSRVTRSKPIVLLQTPICPTLFPSCPPRNSIGPSSPNNQKDN
jgi:hypothetical protein